MYIAQAYKGLHEGWKYVIGFVVIFLVAAQLIGAIPLMGAIMYKTIQTGEMINMSDMSAIYTLFDPNTTLFLMLIPFVVGMIALFLWTKFLHKLDFTSLSTSRKKIDWKRAGFAFSLWAMVTIVLTVVDYKLSPENYEWNFDLNKFAVLAVIGIVLIPIQTSFEEYLFRGYLMQGIGVNSKNKQFAFIILYIIFSILLMIFIHQYFNSVLYNISIGSLLVIFYVLLKSVFEKNNFFDSNLYKSVYRLINRKTTPLIITSAVFGLMHIANPEVEKIGYIIMVYYIGTGFFLGIITLMDEGIELALGFHAANNLVTALLVTANWTAFQTNSILKDMSEPAAGYDVLVPVLVIFPILLFIFAKKDNGDNCAEKLAGIVGDPSSQDSISEIGNE